ncbi:MAG: HEAT repeat domain-containing protein [Sulfuricellaceae bacterium]|jgi:hypothetical protein
MNPPDALILIAPGCPHCPGVLEGLSRLLKEGVIGRLEAVNVAVYPERAEELGVKGVPWVRLGPYELEGAITLDELRRRAQAGESIAGLADYFLELLKTGRRVKVEALAWERPERLLALLELLRDPHSSMAVRLGIGAVMEEFQGTGVTDILIPGLGELTRHDDRLVRADACHFLSLIGGAGILPFMRACLDDPDPEVREIAAEVLDETAPGAAG